MLTRFEHIFRFLCKYNTTYCVMVNRFTQEFVALRLFMSRARRRQTAFVKNIFAKCSFFRTFCFRPCTSHHLLPATVQRSCPPGFTRSSFRPNSRRSVCRLHRFCPVITDIRRGCTDRTACSPLPAASAALARRRNISDNTSSPRAGW